VPLPYRYFSLSPHLTFAHSPIRLFAPSPIREVVPWSCRVVVLLPSRLLAFSRLFQTLSGFFQPLNQAFLSFFSTIPTFYLFNVFCIVFNVTFVPIFQEGNFILNT